MDECQATTSGEEDHRTIVAPTLAPSSYHRKQASQHADDESAHPFTELFVGSVSAVAAARFWRRPPGLPFWITSGLHGNVRFWSKGDIGGRRDDVCFASNERASLSGLGTSGSCQRRMWSGYSITASARASRIGERLRPRAFADFALMASSKRVGCSMGRSAGLAPFKILSTKAAERRVISTMFGP
jgi:hypothetical protein